MKNITVIRTKSVKYMPFLVSFFLLLNAGAWVAFAVFRQDTYILVPNVVGLASGLAQLIIYFIYMNKPSPVNSAEMVDYDTEDDVSIKAAEEGSINVHEIIDSKSTRDQSQSKSISDAELSKRSRFHKIMRTLSCLSQPESHHSGYILVP